MKSETQTKFIEPHDTISWAAWHIRSEAFHDKWAAGQLTFKEYRELIDACIVHVESMLASRNIFQRSLKRDDEKRLRYLRIIRSGLCINHEERDKYKND